LHSKILHSTGSIHLDKDIFDKKAVRNKKQKKCVDGGVLFSLLTVYAVYAVFLCAMAFFSKCMHPQYGPFLPV
jgi:hypothetical protein